MVSPGRNCSRSGLSFSPQRAKIARRGPRYFGDLIFGKRTCKPNSVVCGHSSRRRVAADAHQRPTRRFRRPADGNPLQGGYPQIVQSRLSASGRCAAEPGSWLALPSLFGLAPCGVYPASSVTAGAVRSYRTISPLLLRRAALWTSPSGHPNFVPKHAQGRYIFCGTSRPRALKPASRTLSGTLPCGVRTFLPRRTALAHVLRQRPPGPPASS